MLVQSPSTCCTGASTSASAALRDEESFRDIKGTGSLSMRCGLLEILGQVESSKRAVLKMLEDLDAQHGDDAIAMQQQVPSRSSFGLADDLSITAEGQRSKETTVQLVGVSAQIPQVEFEEPRFETPGLPSLKDVGNKPETEREIPTDTRQNAASTATNSPWSRLALDQNIDDESETKRVTQSSEAPDIRPTAFEDTRKFKLFSKDNHKQKRSRATYMMGEILSSTVDLEAHTMSCLRRGCLCLVHSQYFDIFIGCVILINSACIGIEAQWSLESGMENQWPLRMDILFILIYSTEIAIRLIAAGWSNFFNPWFILDFGIVIIGTLAFVATLLSEGASDEDYGWVMVIRVFRLLRLLRALRMLRTFRVVWRLVHGLLNSYKILFSTAALLIMTIYVFAIIGVEFISKRKDLQEDEATSEIIKMYFSSLQTTMLTFGRFVSLDSMYLIYEPLIAKSPWLILYFGSIILLVSVGLMNVVTAVLVEAALDIANEDMELTAADRAHRLAKSIPVLEQLFADMDQNGDGTLTREEVERVPLDVIPTEFFENHRAIGSMHDIFMLLDVDNGGTLSHDEFLEGLVSLFMHEASVETLQIYRLTQKTWALLHKVDARLRSIDGLKES